MRSERTLTRYPIEHAGHVWHIDGTVKDQMLTIYEVHGDVSQPGQPGLLNEAIKRVALHFKVGIALNDRRVADLIMASMRIVGSDE